MQSGEAQLAAEYFNMFLAACVVLCHMTSVEIIKGRTQSTSHNNTSSSSSPSSSSTIAPSPGFIALTCTYRQNP